MPDKPQDKPDDTIGDKPEHTDKATNENKAEDANKGINKDGLKHESKHSLKGMHGNTPKTQPEDSGKIKPNDGRRESLAAERKAGDAGERSEGRDDKTAHTPPPLPVPPSSGAAAVLRPEVERGNVEYKYALLATTAERREHLATQMQWRIGEGHGEAIYELGVADDGTPRGLSDAELSQTLHTLCDVARRIDATCRVLRTATGEHGQVAEVLVRRNSPEHVVEVRVALLGNVDAGKSTTLGVLASGALDNGRGFARSCVFRHPHELLTGRTSSVCSELVGFDPAGHVLNHALHGLDAADVVKRAAKVVNFIDLAGHERYFRTTLFGLTGMYPDYALVAVGANMGCGGMTREHVGCALALKLPFFIVVTKTDLAPPNVLGETLAQLKRVVQAPGVRKLAYVVRCEDDAITAAQRLADGCAVPVFCVSNVSGAGVGLLRTFLSLLPPVRDWCARRGAPAEFVVDNDFSVNGVGTVVAGTLLRGTVAAGDTLLLGPDGCGRFAPCQVKSIEVGRLRVPQVCAGVTAALALRKVERRQLRKGMVLVAAQAHPAACYEFDADVVVLYHSTTLCVGYEAVVHCGAVHQTARIVRLERPLLRTGDRARATFRFAFTPEYLTEGARIIFREGRAKGIGVVAAVHPHQPGAPRPDDGRRTHARARPRDAARRTMSDPSDIARRPCTQGAQQGAQQGHR